MACFDVIDAEEEPLCMPSGVDIILKQQMVVVVSHFYGCSQITRLKTALENERIIVWSCCGIEGVEVDSNELLLLRVCLMLGFVDKVGSLKKLLDV